MSVAGGGIFCRWGLSKRGGACARWRGEGRNCADWQEAGRYEEGLEEGGCDSERRQGMGLSGRRSRWLGFLAVLFESGVVLWSGGVLECLIGNRSVGFVGVAMGGGVGAKLLEGAARARLLGESARLRRRKFRRARAAGCGQDKR